ncbi:hypothetical protein [Bacillus mycoides]|uniref:hypothetical protein n=1 Tax=Bacillus mycoides TaxID=1405 RepID=UPI003D655A63
MNKKKLEKTFLVDLETIELKNISAGGFWGDYGTAVGGAAGVGATIGGAFGPAGALAGGVAGIVVGSAGHAIAYGSDKGMFNLN